jgi:predicted RNA methylase
MPSSTAKKFKDAYFTSIEDAKWCIQQLEKHFDLNGLTALEPAVGSGIFVEASEGTGLLWETNDLYPEFSQGFKPNTSYDFCRVKLSEISRYDIVITNPPFGEASSLAKKFLKRSLEISDKVAMLLPKGCRRGTFIDKHVPRDVKILLDEDLPGGTFFLPDGSEKLVGCAFMVFSREEGYHRKDILDYEPKGYKAEGKEFRPKRGDKVENWWPDWASHNLCLWGSAGQLNDRGRIKPFACSLFLKLTQKQYDVVADIDWEPLIARYKTTSPMITAAEAITQINKALKDG